MSHPIKKRVTEPTPEGATEHAKGAQETQGTTFKLGVMTAAPGGGSAQKKFLYVDGKAIKDDQHSQAIWSGELTDHSPIGLEGVADLVGNIGSNQALILGSSGRDETQTVITDKARQLLKEMPENTITRSLEFLKFRENEPCLLLFDRDVEPGATEILDSDGLIDKLSGIIPGFENAGYLVTQSSSSHIYDRKSGACLKGAGNFHLFNAAVGNVPKFRENLKVKFWAAGHGFFKFSTPHKHTGRPQILERFPVDASVFSPERLVYEAGPKLPDSLEWRPGEPTFKEGIVLELDDFRVTAEEKALAEINRAAARKPFEEQRLADTAAKVRSARPSLSESESRKEARRLIQDDESGILQPDHELYFQDGRKVLAGELDKSHLQCGLHDPLEPDYKNWSYCAKIIPLKGGTIGVSSMAHGICKKYSVDKPKGGTSLASEVQRIVDGELPYDEELSEIQDLAKSSGYTTYDLTARVKAVKNARDSADDRQKAAQALPSLLAERNRRLDLKAYLWGDEGQLATMFHRRAQEMKMPVEHLFTAFIPTSANFIPAGVSALVQEGFEQPLIFNAMILGRTGDGKSHAMKVAVGAAELIETAERERYAILKKEFDEDMELWNDKPKNERGEKPTKPIERRRIYQTGGREALMRLHAVNPNGFLWAKDEGEGFAASQNMNRSGRGDDLQQGLEDFNGGPYSKDLCTDGNSYFIPHRKIQKLGTMHTDQLMKQLEADGFEDYRGDQARWLFCAVPFGERKLDLERCTAPKINKVLTRTLKDLYEDLETLEPNPDGYLFDNTAYTLYAAYQHQLRDWGNAEVGSLATAFPKMEQYCIRIAGWLHIINAKLSGLMPAPTIDAQTMLAAIDLTDFFIGQLRLIYASALPGQALAGLMLEVQQFCQVKAVPLTPGKIRSNSRALSAKIDGPTMKQIVAQLVKSGYGQMDGACYRAFSDPAETEEVGGEYAYEPE